MRSEPTDQERTELNGMLHHERVSARMRAVSTRHTGPELKVRSVLHALGFRFRLHRKDLPGSPDIVLPRYRVAIFVHGCFWHRHRGCRRSTFPKSNASYWHAKFAANIERDRKNRRDLRALGWKTLLIWECSTFQLNNLNRRLASFLADAERRRVVATQNQLARRTGRTTTIRRRQSDQ